MFKWKEKTILDKICKASQFFQSRFVDERSGDTKSIDIAIYRTIIIAIYDKQIITYSDVDGEECGRNMISKLLYICEKAKITFIEYL